YPTDRVLKFELAKRLFDAGRFDECIALFQDAKDEPKLRLRCLQYLGQAFYAIGFFDGAIETYRAALETPGATEGETGLELRYGLMISLQGRAEETKDLGSAEEANQIASKIAMEKFGYRDLRVRREQIKELLGRLKAGG